MRIGVEGLWFDAAHYTLEAGAKCMNLHGHTFRVDAFVEGPLDEESGMVLDFAVVKKALKEVLEEWDHSIIVPQRHLEEVRLEGPFKVKIKVIEYPHGTTEYIALSIARELKEKLGEPYRVRVRVYEGVGKFAEADA